MQIPAGDVRRAGPPRARLSVKGRRGARIGADLPGRASGRRPRKGRGQRAERGGGAGAGRGGAGGCWAAGGGSAAQPQLRSPGRERGAAPCPALPAAGSRAPGAGVCPPPPSAASEGRKGANEREGGKGEARSRSAWSPPGSSGGGYTIWVTRGMQESSQPPVLLRPIPHSRVLRNSGSGTPRLAGIPEPLRFEICRAAGRFLLGPEAPPEERSGGRRRDGRGGEPREGAGLEK